MRPFHWWIPGLGRGFRRAKRKGTTGIDSWVACPLLVAAKSEWCHLWFWVSQKKRTSLSPLEALIQEINISSKSENAWQWSMKLVLFWGFITPTSQCSGAMSGRWTLCTKGLVGCRRPNYSWLVVLTILKNMSSSMGRSIPYIMEDKKWLKPPTSYQSWYLLPRPPWVKLGVLDCGWTSDTEKALQL